MERPEVTDVTFYHENAEKLMIQCAGLLNINRRQIVQLQIDTKDANSETVIVTYRPTMLRFDFRKRTITVKSRDIYIRVLDIAQAFGVA